MSHIKLGYWRIIVISLGHNFDVLFVHSCFKYIWYSCQIYSWSELDLIAFPIIYRIPSSAVSGRLTVRLTTVSGGLPFAFFTVSFNRGKPPFAPKNLFCEKRNRKMLLFFCFCYFKNIIGRKLKVNNTRIHSDTHPILRNGGAAILFFAGPVQHVHCGRIFNMHG